MRHWPALDIPDPDDLLMAALDDLAPTAIEEREPGIRVFFGTHGDRDAAHATLIARNVNAIARDVSDEDWAVRSQQNLTPIAVGRIRIVPSAAFLNPADPLFQHGRSDLIDIVIEPSMGFGTGHHATTRLCLAALQTLELSQADALDIGTGSGILAIAAARLGAARVLGIDYDPDAIQSARENLALNPGVRQVSFEVSDLAARVLAPADLVTANLTGAVLVRSADRLVAATRAGGTLILSGILAGEEAAVREAFSSVTLGQRQQEDEWVCLIMEKQ